MRTFFAAGLAAAVSASSVHPFMAESNTICGLCEEAVKHAAAGRDAELEALYTLFPKLHTMINSHYNQRELVNLASPSATCQALNLCNQESVAEMLLAEQPKDLASVIETVNNSSANWVAGENQKFTGASHKEIRQLMGTVVDPEWTITGHVKEFDTVNADFPVNFDARVNWPECEPVINHVRDQSDCGSCWAHGTTEAFNDRMCIATGGAFQKLMSVSDTAGCCNGTECFSFGCNGGQVATPWAWFKRDGVVSGGDYETGEFCYDYTLPICAHHVESPGMISCDDVPFGPTPACLNDCPSNTAIDYAEDKVKSSSSYAVKGVDNIKMEIMTYGTLTAAFTVYTDFPTYKSGVYRHTTGDEEGGHAIKVIGWGVENGEDYWLCVNSWNETWGDEGTFKILMGDCGINNQMHGGLAI